MSRLYALTTRIAELCESFEIPSQPDIDFPHELVEGVKGPIVIVRDGTRLLKTASWAFPRLNLGGHGGEDMR